MAEQPFLIADGPWVQIRDGNPSGLSIFKRHYSAKRKQGMQAQFVGPGESIVLLTPDARALFVWWKQQYRLDGQAGVNCSVFRNEGSENGRASELIEAAVSEAWQRWPGERLYTFVDPSKVRHKRDPGRCFLKAGFKRCGVTPKGLLIFERFPGGVEASGAHLGRQCAVGYRRQPLPEFNSAKVSTTRSKQANPTPTNPSIPKCHP